MPFIQFQVILVVSQAFEPMVAHAAMPLAQRLVKLSDCSSNNKGAWMDTDWWYRIMYCQVQYKTDESLTLLVLRPKYWEQDQTLDADAVALLCQVISNNDGDYIG